MEWISIFLTEYAGRILMAWCAFMTILLLVTLHRIRRIGKQIQEITGNDKRIPDGQGSGADTLHQERAATAKRSRQPGAASPDTGREKASSLNAAPNEADGYAADGQNAGKAAPERPEELLDAVLGEFF